MIWKTVLFAGRVPLDLRPGVPKAPARTTRAEGEGPRRVDAEAPRVVMFCARPSCYAVSHITGFHDTGVCEKTLLSGEPLPRNPEAETAHQLLICHSESLSA